MSVEGKKNTPGLAAPFLMIIAGVILTILGWADGIADLGSALKGQLRSIALIDLALVAGLVLLVIGALKIAKVFKASQTS